MTLERAGFWDTLGGSARSQAGQVVMNADRALGLQDSPGIRTRLDARRMLMSQVHGRRRGEAGADVGGGSLGRAIAHEAHPPGICARLGIDREMSTDKSEQAPRTGLAGCEQTAQLRGARPRRTVMVLGSARGTGQAGGPALACRRRVPLHAAFVNASSTACRQTRSWPGGHRRLDALRERVTPALQGGLPDGELLLADRRGEALGEELDFRRVSEPDLRPASEISSRATGAS